MPVVIASISSQLAFPNLVPVTVSTFFSSALESLVKRSGRFIKRPPLYLLLFLSSSFPHSKYIFCCMKDSTFFFVFAESYDPPEVSFRRSLSLSNNQPRNYLSHLPALSARGEVSTASLGQLCHPSWRPIPRIRSLLLS